MAPPSRFLQRMVMPALINTHSIVGDLQIVMAMCMHVHTLSYILSIIIYWLMLVSKLQTRPTWRDVGPDDSCCKVKRSIIDSRKDPHICGSRSHHVPPPCFDYVCVALESWNLQFWLVQPCFHLQFPSQRELGDLGGLNLFGNWRTMENHPDIWIWITLW